MYFDRFDIAEAYFVASVMHTNNGNLPRPNRVRSDSVVSQLIAMRFEPRPSLKGPESLTENGRAIYIRLKKELRLR